MAFGYYNIKTKYCQTSQLYGAIAGMRRKAICNGEVCKSETAIIDCSYRSATNMPQACLSNASRTHGFSSLYNHTTKKAPTSGAFFVVEQS